jgi:hypothetical protein
MDDAQADRAAFDTAERLLRAPLNIGTAVTMMEKNGLGVDGTGKPWLQLMYRHITSCSGPHCRQ